MFKTIKGRINATSVMILSFFTSVFVGPKLTRSMTHDVAFPFRMGAGFAGDINRVHPFSVLPGLINDTTPPRLYGDPVLVDAATNAYRGFVAADASATAVPLLGVTVRSFPTQQTTGGMASAIGAAVPPVSGVMDALRAGYIMVKLPAGRVVTKGQAAFVWATATAGLNIQGGFQDVASAGNTVPLANARFTGPADATGIVELEVWPA